MSKIKKIKWKYRASMNTWTGTHDKYERFTVEGGLCVTDHGKEENPLEFVTSKHYRIHGDIQAGKDIASDLLNGLNLEIHQENWQKWEDENLKSIKAIQDAQDFLKSLTAKCECETQGDNTCDYCEDQEKKRILAEARKQADDVIIKEAAEKANGYNTYAKETKSPIFNEGYIEGVKSQTAKDYWYRKFKGE
jgi:hypothetical protein